MRRSRCGSGWLPPPPGCLHPSSPPAPASRAGTWPLMCAGTLPSRPPARRSTRRCCFLGDCVVPWQGEAARTPTGYESLWYDTFSGSHAAASEKRQYNSSYASSKYKILNRSYSPLATNENAEDDQRKYPLVFILVLQSWKALLELLCSAPPVAAASSSLTVSQLLCSGAASASVCTLPHGNTTLLSEKVSWWSTLTSLSCTFTWFYSSFGLLQKQSVVLCPL